MAIKISQLDEITEFTGEEKVPVAYQGNNFHFRLKNVKKLITRADLSIDNVDNTTDLNKPVSIATATKLNQKASLVHSHTSLEITDLDQHIVSVVGSTVKLGSLEW